MHSAHGVRQTVGRRTCSHVVRVERSARTAAGCNGEVLDAVFDTPLLVGARNGVLEACRVGGVAGDGNAHVFELHDGNAFRNVIRAVAANIRTGTVGECLFGNYLDGFGIRIEFGFDIGETVDSGNDISCVLAETVEYNAKRLYANLVCVQRDLDGAFCGGKGFVAGEEAEAARFFGKEPLAEVAVAETDLAVFGNGAGNAEGLKSDTDRGSRIGGLYAA